MIARLRLFARLVSFAAAMWILAVVVWAVATGAHGASPPILVLWVFMGGIVTQLILWLIQAARRT